MQKAAQWCKGYALPHIYTGWERSLFACMLGAPGSKGASADCPCADKEIGWTLDAGTWMDGLTMYAQPILGICFGPKYYQSKWMWQQSRGSYIWVKVGGFPMVQVTNM